MQNAPFLFKSCVAHRAIYHLYTGLKILGEKGRVLCGFGLVFAVCKLFSHKWLFLEAYWRPIIRKTRWKKIVFQLAGYGIQYVIK